MQDYDNGDQMNQDHENGDHNGGGGAGGERDDDRWDSLLVLLLASLNLLNSICCMKNRLFKIFIPNGVGFFQYVI